MSITAPVMGGNGLATRGGAASTNPTEADIIAPPDAGPADAQPAAVATGVATQYWDEAIPNPAGPNQLWLLVDGGWRSLTSPSAATRDVVQRAFLGTGSEVRVWFDGVAIVGLVVTGT